jgi:hypothetical protein
MQKGEHAIQQEVYDNLEAATEQCDRLNKMWQEYKGR